MEELYHSLKDGISPDENILLQFQKLNIDDIKEFEDSMGEKIMAVLLEKYRHLFDRVFEYISSNEEMLKVLMDEGSPEEHVFNWYLRYIDFNNISLVLDTIEKYWTRNGIRMYHLIYSLEEYQECRNMMDWYSNNNRLQELRTELNKRNPSSEEFDFKEFELW